MLKDITFGQYFDTASVLHKLDPRTKLLILVLMIVFLFIAGNYFSLVLLLLFTFLVLFLSKVPVKMYLKNIRAVLFIVVFTAIINLFYAGGGKVLFSYWKFTITTGSVSRAIFLSIRIVLLILLSSALTYTTTPNDLTDALENIFSPLRFIGLGSAVHTISMMMTIALRFIPTLVEETEKIMNAQKARGADLENGKLKDRITALIPILVPLLISSIRRAYDLADAMECRCYNGGVGRVKYKTLRFKINDLFASLISILLCAFIIIFNIIF